MTARILWIDPIGTDAFRDETLAVLNHAKRTETRVDFVSLPPDRPRQLESRAEEALVVGDIVRIARTAALRYDGIVIGCFFDTGLEAAREVSGNAVVTGPCESATLIASGLGSRYSILAGRKHWIPRMQENLRRYGRDHALASIRDLGLGVYELAGEPERAMEHLLREGRKAIDEDGAEVLVLGCTADTRSFQGLQDTLGVPVIDAVIAPFKHAEALVEMAARFGWYPGRPRGGEPPVGGFDEWDFGRDSPLAPFAPDRRRPG